MRSKVWLAAVVVLVVLGMAAYWGHVSAAPAPPKVVVNHETRQCAEIFGGDECMDCNPPEGWEVLGFSPPAACPADYTLVEIEPICTHFKVEFCCTVGHSGVHGDCRDMVVNKVARRCAFVEDVENCRLPARWNAKPADVEERDWECPYDLDRWTDDVACVEEEEDSDTDSGFPGGLVCGSGLVLLVGLGAVAALTRFIRG